MGQIDAEIIIVGAGIGGLALAAILKQVGISYKVLERSEAVKPTGAGISLAPNALKMLDQLGLYEEILATSQRMRKLQIWRNNTLWNCLDASNFEPTYQYPILSTERHVFHDILYRAAGVENVLLNSKVADVVDTPGEPVRVVLDGGDDLRCNVVVGADGIRSAVRRALSQRVGKDEAKYLQFTGRVHFSGITRPLENLGDDDLGVTNWVLCDQAILTTWPCKDNRQWYIGVKKAEGEVEKDRSVWRSMTTDAIKNVYGRAFHPFAEEGQFGNMVDKSERVIAANMFQEVEFPSMSRGRVALMGDAAHSMTSFFGQGGCQAIEDAAVLGNLLAENKGSLEDAQDLLGAYASAREDRVKDLSRFSDNFALLHTARLPYGMGPFVRRVLYTLVPAWFWISYLGWLYGYQPTVAALPTPSARGKKA